MAEFIIKLIVAIIIGVSNAIIYVYKGDYQRINYPKTKKIEENQRTVMLAAFTMIEVFVILILMGAEV